jgi:RNA polymerase sigma factor for flagellar operon FliA
MMPDKDTSSCKILPFPSARTKKMTDAEIIAYMPMVEAIAKRIHRKLPACVDLDDLISTGVIGLYDAIKKFDHSKGVQFKTYAEYRVRGAIYDELRALDWIPRSVRRKKKLIEKAQDKLSADRQGVAADSEIKEELHMSDKTFQDTMAKSVTSSVLYLEDYMQRCRNELTQSNHFENPMHAIAYQSSVNFIHQMMGHLSDKEHQIVQYYYFDQKNIKEIGVLLGITESRVSQLHMRAKSKLKQWLEGGVFSNLDVLVA